MKNKVILAFGGNLGDTVSNFKKALIFLKQNDFDIEKISPLYTTPPVNCEKEAKDFYNFVVSGCWQKSPEELLKVTQSIEKQIGRPENHSSFESRLIDIDIITFGDITQNHKKLIIPHPRAKERFFVIVPLNAIEPDLQFSDCNKTVSVILEKLKSEDPELYHQINNSAKPPISIKN